MTAEAALPTSLYLHIPFCRHRCPYCDFAIRVGGEELHEPYLEALLAELESIASGPVVPLETLYLGGGTPSLLRPELLERLLALVRRRFSFLPGAEVTIEANPEGVGAERARAWLAMGINRVSLGVQSLDDTTLRWLGRDHDARGAERALTQVLEAGFENVGCDLIYAVPGQGEESFQRSLSRLIELGVAHVSCYELTVEPGTRLERQVGAGERSAPSEAEFISQHRLARRLLGRAGLRQYEVSNFARPGLESRHNLCYWRHLPYWGAGSGGHGFVPAAAAGRLGIVVPSGAVAIRYWNRRSATAYQRQVAHLGHGRQGYEAITPEQHELERVACGLRLREGLALSEGRQLESARRLRDLGLLRLGGRRAAATPRGEEVLDRVTLELVGGAAGTLAPQGSSPFLSPPLG